MPTKPGEQSIALKNVGRCPTCRGLVALPCKLCAVREIKRKARRFAELRERDLLAVQQQSFR